MPSVLARPHVTAIAFILLLAQPVRAETTVYEMDFDSGLVGWTSLGDAAVVPRDGAVDGGAYMETRRDSTYPGQHRICDRAKTPLTRNLEENFGARQLRFSFYARVFRPQSPLPVDVALESGDTWWSRSVGRADFGWRRVLFEINTEWTDSEAARAGWRRNGASKSWQEVCDHVTVLSLFGSSRILATDRPFVTGVDKIEVGPAPPADDLLLAKGVTSSRNASYFQLVRTMLDNMVAHGRDRYGTEMSPLFAAVLHQKTLDCPEVVPDYPVDPVRLDPGRFANRRNTGGGDVYHDQLLLKTLADVSTATGDERYRKAAIAALRFALNEAVDSKGFPAIGGHMYWHFYEDRLMCQGEHHELWNWPLVWQLWWEADPVAMQHYAALMWQWHVWDKSTGEINRHSDGQKGYAFSFTAGSIVSQWGFVAAQAKPEPYHAWCSQVCEYYWRRRDPATGLFDSSGAERNGVFTTMQATVARDLIVAGRQTGDPSLERIGRAILDGYARYGYDATTERFYSALHLDGTPVEPRVERDLVTGQEGKPVGYLAVWQPHAGWHEEPLAMAQAFAWAAEEIDQQAYLETAQRFGRLIREAWDERYGPYGSWPELRKRLRPLETEYCQVSGVLHSRQSAKAEVDPQAMKAYRQGGYVYQAPFGLFADHYGRVIQFSLNMYRLTDSQQWMSLARDVADEAIRQLWRDRIFVGHPTKQHYMNTDHVGILLYALLQLDATLNGRNWSGDVYF